MMIIDKAFMLLNSLSKSFENFKDALLFGRQDKLSFGEIQTAIKTKFHQMQGDKGHSDKKTQNQAEGLNVKFKKGKKQSQGKKKSGDKDENKKSSNWVEKRKCYGCHKVGHLKKNCPE